jgi:hypothetical protein
MLTFRRGALRYHFSGIAGAGMNPLAQLMRSRGHQVQGSDRALDQGKSPELAARYEQGLTSTAYEPGLRLGKARPAIDTGAASLSPERRR